MASRRVAYGFEFECDECGEVWSPPRLGHGSVSRDWHDCWEDAKAKGWRARKVLSKSGREDWQNLCPTCK